MGNVFNPLMENTNNTYQVLASQMSRIANVFGAPQEANENRIKNCANNDQEQPHMQTI